MEFEVFLKNKAQEFDAILAERLKMKEPETLYEAVRYLPMLGGKRLRPIMAYLSCRAHTNAPNAQAKEVYAFGTVLEMIHNFTLVHDDIMDNDEKRRGKPTVHRKYGLEAGINAGDALFAESFQFLAESSLKPEIIKILVRDVAFMSKGIVEGQQMDVDFEKEPSKITIDDYLVMIEKKTALLFQVAAKGGALIAGASEQEVSDVAEFGRLTGIAFQICDDLLDIMGDEKIIGKPVGSDIRKGKKTLMVIHAFQNAVPEDVAALKRTLGNQDARDEELREAVAVLDLAGSIAFAREIAGKYNRQARSYLSKLPDSKHKLRLSQLMEFMVSRKK